VQACIRADLSEALWRGALARQSGIGLKILLPEMFDREPLQELDGLSLDRLDIECTRYTPAPDLLSAIRGEAPVTEVLTSNLLKSNCLVTGQPDWGSVQIAYSGPEINQEGLLQYLVSFRNHHEFHEQCVERIFMDIWTRCQPTKLAVYARYTRRGGLDINPFRTSYPQALPRNVRNARQ
jgi:7-cyano-7-deazaguanine reductase